MMSLYYENCLRARYCKETGSSIHDFFFSFIEIDIDKFSIKVAFDPIMGIFFQNELNAIDIIEIVEQSIYD